ncbi:PilZ domain-containing protein [Sphingomonas humi]|uniref:PilZ domain-containing protein n=1 Tax=Sphingomonas humi TaxID=335630 RepID=A0ABP7SCV3_9SPHN
MKNFRDRDRAQSPLNSSLLRSKRPRRALPTRAAEDESFATIDIVREEVRLANHRDNDRHRLDNEQVELVLKGEAQIVTLVNVSGGGAMIEGARDLRLWDLVQLHFADGCQVEAAVRWVRANRHGLEFAQETCIETDAGELAAILRAVVSRTFPEFAADTAPVLKSADAPFPTASAPEDDDRLDMVDRERRHPLIWSGQIHFEHGTHHVRLRNISASGALVECSFALRVGAELLLDLGDAGTIFAIVRWVHGDAAGLRFQGQFDLRQLAAARPQVATSAWVAPDYLRNLAQDNHPWKSRAGSPSSTSGQRRKGILRRY